MGRMEDTLYSLIKTQKIEERNKLKFPKFKDIFESKYSAEVKKIYQELGGVLPNFPLNIRAWDMEYSGVAIELDEYLHFNRYRKTTLDSSIYKELPNFPLKEYQTYCVSFEERCLSAGGYGGKWTNKSCEKQFGQANKPRDLSGDGAPRWKQRAFYDFVKDISPLIIGVTMVRIAVWDIIEDEGGERTLEKVLKCPMPSSGTAIDNLINQRLG